MLFDFRRTEMTRTGRVTMSCNLAFVSSGLCLTHSQRQSQLIVSVTLCRLKFEG